MQDYQQVITTLRSAYNRESALQQDQEEKQPWKVAEREQFLTLLLQEGKKTLLEIGAGTGADGLFFQNNGLYVVCTDLSPDMVALCREKGLEAYAMDFLSLDFPPASFDALYALNCLLHVPARNLHTVLQRLRDLLRPGGLFFYVGNLSLLSFSSIPRLFCRQIPCQNGLFVTVSHLACRARLGYTHLCWHLRDGRTEESNVPD